MGFKGQGHDCYKYEHETVVAIDTIGIRINGSSEN